MSYNNESKRETWDWQSLECLEDTTCVEMSNCLLNGGAGQDEDNFSCIFDVATTPVRACGDLSYQVPERELKRKELEEYSEQPSPQVKRRRMLQFESEVVDAHLLDDMFLRSKETPDSLGDVLSEEMSEWVAGFTEGTSASCDEYLDPSSEGWIANCLNDTELHFNTDLISSAASASDVQIDITELCNTPQYDGNAVKTFPIHTCRNVVLRGKKSYMHTPPKLASSVVYPFTFIKPCGVHGDMTLKDINQWILAPEKSKQNEQDPSLPYSMSAFSGKPVVGKTKIRTEGGDGSITIVRTRG